MDNIVGASSPSGAVLQAQRGISRESTLALLWAAVGLSDIHRDVWRPTLPSTGKLVDDNPAQGTGQQPSLFR